MGYRTSRGQLWGCVMACLLAVGFAGPALGDVVSYTTETCVFEFDEDLVTPPSPWAGFQFVGDNSLMFTPSSYVPFMSVQSTAGTPLIDADDATFVIAISALPGSFLGTVNVLEDGDFDLFSLNGGTSATMAKVNAIIDLMVQVDGTWHVLPSQTMMFSQTLGGPFNQDGSFNLIDDPGMAQKWYGEAVLDISAALASAGVQGRATQVVLTIDNKLWAASEATTHAFIAKKRLTFEVVVPEPSVLALLIGGCCAWLVSRRRRI